MYFAWTEESADENISEVTMDESYIVIPVPVKPRVTSAKDGGETRRSSIEETVSDDDYELVSYQDAGTHKGNPQEQIIHKEVMVDAETYVMLDRWFGDEYEAERQGEYPEIPDEVDLE